jgi:hypothetical protein
MNNLDISEPKYEQPVVQDSSLSIRGGSSPIEPINTPFSDNN